MFIKFYNSKLIILIILCLFPFELLADKKKFECRYLVKDKGYYTNKIFADTWAMSGKIKNTTAFLSEEFKVEEAGKLHFDKADNGYLIIIDKSPSFYVNHLTDKNLKYLIEINYFNILGKTKADQKNIINRTYLKGDCRVSG